MRLAVKQNYKCRVISYKIVFFFALFLENFKCKLLFNKDIFFYRK